MITEATIRGYKAYTGLDLTPSKLWASVRLKFGLPKASDLLYRFLHNKVKTGTQLEWLAEDLQMCPHHRVPLTIDHIFIRCDVARAVWEEVRLVWYRLAMIEGKEEQAMPPIDKITELIVAMALAPRLTGPARRRWEIICQTATWGLWKAYLSYSFQDPFAMWSPQAARNNFCSMLYKRILTDRITCTAEKYRSKAYNKEAFKEIWAEDPTKLRLKRRPLCLIGDSELSLSPAVDSELSKVTVTT